MNFEIDLPSIGTNLGCLCINYDVRETDLLNLCSICCCIVIIVISHYNSLDSNVSECRIYAIGAAF